MSEGSQETPRTGMIVGATNPAWDHVTFRTDSNSLANYMGSSVESGPMRPWDPLMLLFKNGIFKPCHTRTYQRIGAIPGARSRAASSRRKLLLFTAVSFF